MEPIRRVAVIGAGVMGAGIAAQIANAGVPVLLLDVAGTEADRRAPARAAVERLRKMEPAPLMSAAAARLIEIGTIDDDLGLVAACDWVVEAIVEKLDVKQSLYRRLDAVRQPGTAISSNTSTIPLHLLIDGMSEAFARDFLITHFFNPPRYMRLLELVTGPRTDTALTERVADFCDRALGKGVVRCKDSPGFIANRLGVFWMTAAVSGAEPHGLSVEEADAVMGRPFGIPKTGVFGLTDLVGLDLMPHINASMKATLAPEDAFHSVNRDMKLVAKMIEAGFTGRKGRGGFYRVTKRGTERLREAIDLGTGEYRPQREADLPELKSAGRDLRAVFAAPGRVGAYAWAAMGTTLAYAASLLPEAADEIVAIDAAMRLGYAWKEGPFELIDRVGADWLIDQLRARSMTVPPILALAAGRRFYRVENGQREQLGLDGNYHPITRQDGVFLLEDIKRAAKPVLRNASAAVWDIGQGVLCFEFTSKSNSLDEQIMTLLGQTIALVREKYTALVIYNEGSNFSVGANLGLALFAANMAAWPLLETMVSTGQQTLRKLKYAPFPVVAAPAGMALGGGCEILLHSSAIQAHAETYAGLVECGVGLLPGWGGCKEMLGRWSEDPATPNGPMPAPAKVFEMVSTARVAKSAAEAREMLILRAADGITMNRDRLLADARARALAMAPGYTPPVPREIVLPGPSGKVALDLAAQGFARRGIATAHDVVVAGQLATVLTGGETDLIDRVSEDRLLDLERAGFMALLRTDPTLARIEHTLETGKPLRN